MDYKRLMVGIQNIYFFRLSNLIWLNLTDNGIETFTNRIFARNIKMGKYFWIHNQDLGDLCLFLVNW